MADVRLDRVRKVYDNGHVAVADATFDARAGELLVLVGPSGCGKSTTLRMIAGLEAVSAGTISIGTRIVNDVPPKERDIAMVFQSYALYPHMTVFENLAFGLRLRSYDKAEILRRVHHAASVLDLAGQLGHKPRQLSGGQRQRVALGRALVREPAVFLLDEPLSNLDAKLRLTMRTEIAKLHRRLGATMIYVTHDQIEAMTLGQRIVLFRGGEIQQIDTPMRLYDRPANVFVAGFLGSPPMNFFRGRLVRDDGIRLALAAVAVSLEAPPFDVDALQSYFGHELIVGLRPEDLCLAAASPPAAVQPELTAMVESVEPVGREAFVSARLGADEIVARIPAQTLPEVGRPVNLTFSPARLHFFDAASEQRVELGGAAV